MPRTEPTLNIVAKAAGVSRQTVSNVINSPERVAPETLSRVQNAIDELSYRPNRVARSLRTQASRLLGYVVPPESNPVLDRFIHAITESAADRGFHVLLFTAPSGAEGLERYAELLAQQAVDGFILSETVVGDPRHAWLAARGVPFVAFGRTWTGEDQGDWVDVDGAAGVEQAVDHVYEQGHRKIAFIGWPPGSGSGDDRLSGYERACARLGVDPQVVRGEMSVAEGYALAGELLDRPGPPTAIVCVSDFDALGALRAVMDRGHRPGHDVAVTGFDDIPSAGMPGVELTSIRQPIDDVGRAVVHLLLTQLGHDGPDAGPSHRLFQPTLSIRTSTRPGQRPARGWSGGSS